MPILSSDTLLKYSTTVGSAGNTNSGTAGSSLGKFVSTTSVITNVPLNLFPALTGDANFNSAVDYICVFITNNHSTLTWYAPKLWLSNKTAGATLVAAGLDPVGVVALTASNQAQTIANTSLAPTGVTFSTPTAKASGLSIGNMPPNTCRAVWFRRTAANTGALNPDVFWANFSGDSSA